MRLRQDVAVYVDEVKMPHPRSRCSRTSPLDKERCWSGHNSIQAGLTIRRLRGPSNRVSFASLPSFTYKPRSRQFYSRGSIAGIFCQPLSLVR